jgi:excisionase family DNA binding protein
MEKLLLSPAEAATHLSIGRSKVYELMRLRQLRSVKIGALRLAEAEARIRCISMATVGEARPPLVTAPTGAGSARR